MAVEHITQDQARAVLEVFFDEMDQRHWSTSVSEITTAQHATIRRFRPGSEQ